ncbi:regulatory LuxR family protein [Ureibacillus xyleni]|uniref:Regulatory LuxR family protein n=1 Tax=Ureibacillus xyleni TaxID=614648 RepID=A0A285RXM4_9BACL|nr:helix-turn-helix transcriptional regulator [Ureibacillus xyleni]SOB99341.1 regulatory LuxR family protein [Ureibacillus xyleni]
MKLDSWTIKEELKSIVHLHSQEEQICSILKLFEKLFKGERLSFYRFSPIGYVGEGVALLYNGQLQALNYIRDDIRGLPAIRQAIEKKQAIYYSGQDIITQITSRYQQNYQLKSLLVVPIIANNITISYICREVISEDHSIPPEQIEDISFFGKIAGELLIQPQKTLHPKLSPRENEILKALANGFSTKEMTNILLLSEATIKQYIKSILVKLNAKNRVHAVSIYMSQYM